MPKSDKRAETRRAERIARAHSTELKQSEVNQEPDVRRSSPGRKAPAQGIARYPWATAIIFCLIIVGIVAVLYTTHIGPFAPATTSKAKPTAAATAKAASTPASNVTPAATSTTDASSPCVKSNILSAITDTAPAPTAAQIQAIKHSYTGAQNVTDTNKIYCAGINTTKGLIVVELDPKIAPKTVNNFVFLAQNHFYDGLKFHRVVQGFVAQGGDPTGTGSGGPGYKFDDEPVQGNYQVGSIAMANSGPNTNGSQFFIGTGDQVTSLPKQYNLFGHVVQGLDVAQKLTVTGDTPSPNVTPDVMTHVIVTAAS
jgi:cyclophilin family peptidyl-prolyl cis-trans isomerase